MEKERSREIRNDAEILYRTRSVGKDHIPYHVEIFENFAGYFHSRLQSAEKRQNGVIAYLDVVSLGTWALEKAVLDTDYKNHREIIKFAHLFDRLYPEISDEFYRERSRSKLDMSDRRILTVTAALGLARKKRSYEAPKTF